MKKKVLNLAGGLSEKIAAQLNALPCFQGVADKRLFSIAEGKMRNKYTIECRLTAMLVIVGATPLNDEVFQLPPTAKELSIGG
jgi:hypothetical protein